MIASNALLNAYCDRHEVVAEINLLMAESKAGLRYMIKINSTTQRKWLKNFNNNVRDQVANMFGYWNKYGRSSLMSPAKFQKHISEARILFSRLCVVLFIVCGFKNTYTQGHGEMKGKEHQLFVSDDGACKPC